jgi:mono/diheme cytochrome c family protein
VASPRRSPTARTARSCRGPFALEQADDEPDDPPRDTPLALFHAAPAGIACASCHADGGDDGHTWQIVPGGVRTQPIGGGVTATAPFHWDGGLPNLATLWESVGVARMGLDPRIAADLVPLGAWIDGLPVAPVAGPPPDPEQVHQGEALFADPAVGCADCHSGPRYSDGDRADVGTGGIFEVPTLLGVGARLPVMHNGCAETLQQRFTDPVCGGGDLHGVTSNLDDDDIGALVAFLRTL